MVTVEEIEKRTKYYTPSEKTEYLERILRKKSLLSRETRSAMYHELGIAYEKGGSSLLAGVALEKSYNPTDLKRAIKDFKRCIERSRYKQYIPPYVVGGHISNVKKKLHRLERLKKAGRLEKWLGAIFVCLSLYFLAPSSITGFAVSGVKSKFLGSLLGVLSLIVGLFLLLRRNLTR